jgi:hypothetical protein
MITDYMHLAEKLIDLSRKNGASSRDIKAILGGFRETVRDTQEKKNKEK